MKHLQSPKLYLLGLFYSGALIILSSLLIIILERFFRFEEHYDFVSLLSSWPYEWYRLIEGLFIFIGYELVIGYVDLRFVHHEDQIKMEELEGQIKQSSLRSMATELNPHFLYNAMNSISMTVRLKEYAKSIKMIATLNDLLRKVLNTRYSQLITLQQELDLLQKYLDIELMRFGDRVSLDLKVEEDTHEALVPQLILQPLVENAFKHGMSGDFGKQKLLISIFREREKLSMKIFNSTKTTLPVDVIQESKGIGLKNVLNRLTRLYGTQFKFQQEQKSEGIEFRVIIPFRT